MSRDELGRYRALVFDCYGTLIDWEGGIWAAAQPLLRANGRTDISRSALLQAFSRAESAAQAETPDCPYPAILERAHREIAAALGLETSGSLDRVFGGSVPDWPAFEDSAAALRLLATRYHLFVLSNVDRAGFAGSAARLGVTFDGVMTAEDVGSYKPDPRGFHAVLEWLERDFGFSPGDILHTAQSQFHDLVPAARLGLATAWIDRQRLSEGGDWGATAVVAEQHRPDFLFFSLAGMAAAVRSVPERRPAPA